ncbi:10517_t:CDS:1, partial [Racocetra fulgida]
HFQNIFQNMGKSKIIKTKDNVKFFMATLDEIVNLNCLPTGYHTAHLPLPDSCDLPIRYLTGKIYICGHSYHDKCYNIYKACKYCLEYYKKGITKQAKAFKKGLEKLMIKRIF